jgi:hypothetical protein
VSRIEGKIERDGKVEVEAVDILAQLAADRFSDATKRRAAVAQYLSASDGWREACEELGGAFAPADTKKRG